MLSECVENTKFKNREVCMTAHEVSIRLGCNEIDRLNTKEGKPGFSAVELILLPVFKT